MRTSIQLKSLFIYPLIFLIPILLNSCSNPEEPEYQQFYRGASVAYSSDNGSSWAIQYDSSTSNSIIYSITSLDNGLTLTALRQYELLRSENNGSNWIQLSPEGLQKKIISTDILNTGVMIGFSDKVLSTTDNGIDFFTVVSGINNVISDISIDSSGTGYITGYELLLKTTDYGQTWFSPLVNDSLVSEYYMNTINQINSEKIYVLAHKITEYSRKLFKSDDGFMTASVIDFPYQLFETNCISFHDENIGISTTEYGDGSIARTIDGGLTWNRISLSGEGVIILVKFINGICFATATSKIYSSTDLGITWNTTHLSDSYNFNDIHSPSPYKIFMSGNIIKPIQ